jgi:WD40 repeat protein/tetratricopeptide (TPR) repeat protein
MAQAAALSPDGRLVLTIGAREVAVWDFTEGRPVVPALNCEDEVRSAWLSPDGQRVLTLTAHEARLWSLGDDNLPAVTLHHDESLCEQSSSPDGRQIATVTRDNYPQLAVAGLAPLATATGSEVRLWDAAGRPAGPPRLYEREATVTFTPKGPRVMTAGTVVRAWDALTGLQAGAGMKHEGPASVLGYSRDGRRLFTTVWTDEDSQIPSAVCAWDLDKGELLYPPIRHPRGVMAGVELQDDGRLLVTKSSSPDAESSEVQVWDAATGQRVGKPIQQADAIHSVSVSLAAQRVLVDGQKGWQLWDLDTGKALASPTPFNADYSLYLRFSPDGRHFVTCEGTEASIREAASGQVVRVLKHRYPAQGAIYSDDGRHIVTGSLRASERADDMGVGEVHVWDAATGEPVGAPLRGRAFGCVTSPNVEHLVLFKDALHSQFQVYHVASGLPMTPAIDVWGSDLTSFSADGRYLLYADGNRARVLDLVPEKHTPEEWGDLARLLSGARLDRSDTALPLDTDERRRLWERFRAAPEGYFRAAPDATTAWHLHESLRHEGGAEWFADLWHLDRMAPPGTASPREDFRRGVAHTALGEWKAAREALSRVIAADRENWRAHYLLGQGSAAESQWNAAAGHYTKALVLPGASRPHILENRAEAYARLGRWQDAATDYEGLRETRNWRDRDWLTLTWLRLQLGDADGYQKICQAWIEREGESRHRDVKQQIAWTTSLAPYLGLDRKKAVALARDAVQAAPKDHLARLTLGAALYRDGQYADAIESLNESVKLPGRRLEPPPGQHGTIESLNESVKLPGSGGYAPDWLFLALAHHRLGHTDEARQWLTKGINHPVPSPATDWRTHIMLSVLRREAEEAIKGKPGPEK